MRIDRNWLLPEFSYDGATTVLGWVLFLAPFAVLAAVVWYGIVFGLALCYMPRLKRARRAELAAWREFYDAQIAEEAAKGKVAKLRDRLKEDAAAWREARRVLAAELATAQRAHGRAPSRAAQDEIDRLTDEIATGDGEHGHLASRARLRLAEGEVEVARQRADKAGARAAAASKVRQWYAKRTFRQEAMAV